MVDMIPNFSLYLGFSKIPSHFWEVVKFFFLMWRSFLEIWEQTGMVLCFVVRTFAKVTWCSRDFRWGWSSQLKHRLRHSNILIIPSNSLECLAGHKPDLMTFPLIKSEGMSLFWSYFNTEAFCRFADRSKDRSARFISAYRQGLSGAQAAWANRKYHGHRVLPPDMVVFVKETIAA